MLCTKLTTLKTLQKPLTQRFICSSSHWIAGEITIDEEGETKILFIDSLGVAPIYETTEEVIKIANRIFPQCEIFVSEKKRQNALSGCSIFALNDVATLYTLRLEEQYDQTKLFGYIANNPSQKISIKETKGTDLTITSCKLPLSLNRTMQSEKLLTEIIPKATVEEQKIPVNKKGETAELSATKSFQTSPETGKRQNTRLFYKLDKMAEHVFDYLLKHSTREREEQMKAGTVAAFIEKASPITILDEQKPLTDVCESSPRIESSEPIQIVNDTPVTETSLKNPMAPTPAQISQYYKQSISQITKTPSCILPEQPIETEDNDQASNTLQ